MGIFQTHLSAPLGQLQLYGKEADVAKEQDVLGFEFQRAKWRWRSGPLVFQTLKIEGFVAL